MSGTPRQSTDLRPELGRVRGLGSAQEGTHHFWLQRLTSVALVPLTLWFVIGVVGHMGADYQEYMDWISTPPVAVLMILTLIATFWHAALGLQVVAEDYVHDKRALLALLILIKLSCFALATAGVIAVLRCAL